MLDIVQALHNAHIYHQDFYPSNWMILDGVVSVIDFDQATVGPEYDSDDVFDIETLVITITAIWYGVDEHIATNMICDRTSIINSNMSIDQIREVIH